MFFNSRGLRRYKNRFRRRIAPTGDEKETEMSFTKSNRLTITALLIVIGSAGSGFAQQGTESAGMVRISSPRSRSQSGTTNGQPVQQVGGHRMAYGESCQTGNVPMGSGYAGSGCPTGNCPTGNCPGGCPTGNCPGGCFHGKFGEHYCKHSPDYGFSPPAKYPLHRRGVEYTNYYPQQWYGAGADYSGSYAPMVYQPTDTTQLGYYYQHVPFWQPMPNRLPPRPIPAQWHIKAPPVQASRYTNGAWAGYMGGYVQGGYSSAAITTDGSCPPTGVNVQPGSPQVAPPMPLQQQVVPAIQPTPLQSEIDSGIDSEYGLPAASGAVGQPGALPPEPGSSGQF